MLGEAGGHETSCLRNKRLRFLDLHKPHIFLFFWKAKKRKIKVKMCQRMCSSIKHPFSRARKAQLLISMISWPFALATIFTTCYSPHAWIQFIAVSLLLLIKEGHLTIRR